MLKNIKSLFIIKKIFMHLSDYRLLKLIKYNKLMQRKLNINLYNYRIFKGKYIEYDKNGNGKEYDEDDDLIFEGQYLNGERNGKGKEYYFNSKLKFEGEYLNGERNGKAKEYYDNGKLEFEGEYLKGKKKWKSERI